MTLVDAISLPELPLPAYCFAIGACAAYAVGLWAVDAYTPADVRHWDRLAKLRGLDAGRDLGDRVADRLPLIRRLREEVDINHLLRVAGSLESADSWLAGTAAYALGIGAIAAAADGLSLMVTGRVWAPLLAVLLLILLVVCARYLRLRGRASGRQERVADQLADALLGLAVLVPGIPAEDALSLLARCQRDGQLAKVLDEHHMSQVLGPEADFRATRERYWAVGRSLRVPLFQELSLMMRGIETEGLSPREEYPALSLITAEHRLSQNRLRAARAKTAAAAAIALLLVPLLMMVGGGIAFAFLGSVGG